MGERKGECIKPIQGGKRNCRTSARKLGRVFSSDIFHRSLPEKLGRVLFCLARVFLFCSPSFWGSSSIPWATQKLGRVVWKFDRVFLPEPSSSQVWVLHHSQQSEYTLESSLTVIFLWHSLSKATKTSSSTNKFSSLTESNSFRASSKLPIRHSSVNLELKIWGDIN